MDAVARSTQAQGRSVQLDYIWSLRVYPDSDVKGELFFFSQFLPVTSKPQSKYGHRLFDEQGLKSATVLQVWPRNHREVPNRYSVPTPSRLLFPSSLSCRMSSSCLASFPLTPSVRLFPTCHTIPTCRFSVACLLETSFSTSWHLNMLTMKSEQYSNTINNAVGHSPIVSC